MAWICESMADSAQVSSFSFLPVLLHAATAFLPTNFESGWSGSPQSFWIYATSEASTPIGPGSMAAIEPCGLSAGVSEKL